MTNRLSPPEEEDLQRMYNEVWAAFAYEEPKTPSTALSDERLPTAVEDEMAKFAITGPSPVPVGGVGKLDAYTYYDVLTETSKLDPGPHHLLLPQLSTVLEDQRSIPSQIVIAAMM